MAQRTINITLEYLERAASDPDFREALALAMMIKANYSNSVFMNHSLRRLQSLMHINFQHMSKALKKAMGFGLVKTVTYMTVKGKERTDLIAARLPKEGRYARINICDSNHGKQMFLQSNIQDNLDTHSRTNRHQSLKDVCDLLLLAFLTVRLEGYSKRYDAEKWQGLERLKKHAGKAGVQKTVEEASNRRKREGENFLNTGFSYDKMGDMFGGTLTRYKIAALVRKGKEEGLFTSERHDIVVKGDDPFSRPTGPLKPEGRGIRGLFKASMKAYAGIVKSEYLDATIAYNRLETVAPLMKRCYRGVITEGNMPVPVWLMRMANSYHTYCSIVGRRRRSMKGSAKAYNCDHVR